MPFVAGAQVRSHQMWVSSPPPPSASVHYIYLHFPFRSKPSWLTKLKTKRALQRGLPDIRQDFKQALPVWGFGSESPTLQEIKEGDHLSASSRLRGWKLSAVLSFTPHRQGIAGKSHSDLKRRLVAECQAAGAGSAGIAAMRGNMSE